MKPITPVVPGHRLPITTFAKKQEPYNPLPSYRDEEGRVVTRWHLSFTERVQILLSGNLWLTVLTFRNKLQPVKIDTECPLEVVDGNVRNRE